MSLAWSPQASVTPSWRYPASRFSPVSPRSSWSLPRRPSSPSCGSPRASPSTRSVMSDHSTHNTRGTSAKVVAGSLLGGVASAIALVVPPPSPQTLDTLGWIWPPLLLGLVLWMTAQTRRQPPSHRHSWLLYPVFAVMTFSAAGCGYETIQTGSGGTPAPVAGDRLLDVGGHRLNIRCVGSGSPAVVLETGLGESASA